MQQLYQVVQDCFGRELNDLRYLKSIEDFTETYRNLPHAKDPAKQLSVTIKVHCIFDHITEMIEHTGKALGIFSAHAFESVHYDFLQTYQRYKVPVDHKNYGKQLKNGTVNYNSYHIHDGYE